MSVFYTSVLFQGHVLLGKGISANQEKVEKVKKNWPVSRNIKEIQFFLELASTTGNLLIDLPRKHDTFMRSWVQPLTRTRKNQGPRNWH